MTPMNWAWFWNLGSSLNRKSERFKDFEVDPRLKRDDVIINLIIILNIYKYQINRKIN